MTGLNYETNIQMIAEVYGEDNQLIQMAEECSELAQAAIKLRNARNDRGASAATLRDSAAALCEKIADVLIMCEQLIFLEGCEGDVRKMIDEKLSRQRERMKAVSGE